MAADAQALLKQVITDLGARQLLTAPAFQKFKALLSQGGVPWTRLVEVGVPAGEVLAALSRASGIPVAPIERLKKPDRSAVNALSAVSAWKLLAVPFGRDGDQVLLAFADPQRLSDSALPPHRGHLALEAHVRTMLTAFYGPEPVTPIPLTTPACDPDESAKTFIRAPTGDPVPTAPASGGDPAPTQVGPYAIEHLIGRGGMATVYLGRDGKSGQPIALKLMQAHLLQDKTFVLRFLQEAKATESLRHENIVQLYDCGESTAGYFMASEFVDGGNVEELLGRMGGRVPTLVAVDLVSQMLRGLEYAHEAGIIHRDLKPQNLLVSKSGAVKIADFGIAKTAGTATLTQTGMLVGTPAYMSPEQAEGKDVDRRSDLFTAGTILYELLSGRSPFASDSPAASLTRIVAGEAPPLLELRPAIPPELDAIIDRLMARDREARYPDAASALAELEAFAREFGGKVPGTVIAEALADPKGSLARLDLEEAETLYQKAQALLSSGGAAVRALLLLHRALLLNPNHEAARALFDERAPQEGLKLDGSQSPKIAELEQLLAQNPNTPGVLAQLANLHRMEGNLPRAVMLLRRYLKLKPKDGYVASQLKQLTGETPRPVAGSTAALVAGIRTGGFAKPNPNPTRTTSQPAAAPAKKEEHEGIVFYEGGQAPTPEWKRLASRFWPYAAAALVVVLIVRGVLRFIDKTGEDTYQKTVELSDKMAAQKMPQMQKLQQTNDQEIREAGDGETRMARKEFESGKELFDQGQYAAAAAELKRVREEYPGRAITNTAQVYEARALTLSGQPVVAQQLLDGFIAQHPDSELIPEAYLRRGEAFAKQGSAALAVNDWNEVVRQYPTTQASTEALYLRAQARFASGQKADGIADANLLLAKVPPQSPLGLKAAELLQKHGGQ